MDSLAQLFGEVECCSEDDRSEPNGQELGEFKETHGLSNKCRGCGKEFLRLLGHLSARGSICRQNYTDWELKDYQEENSKEALKKYKEHNKTKIAEDKKKYYNEVKSVRKKRSDMSMWEAVQAALLEVSIDTASFACICCHGIKFRSSVTEVNLGKLRENLPEMVSVSIHLKSLISEPIFKTQNHRMKDEKNFWLCNACHGEMKKGEKEFMQKMVELIKNSPLRPPRYNTEAVALCLSCHRSMVFQEHLGVKIEKLKETWPGTFGEAFCVEQRDSSLVNLSNPNGLNYRVVIKAGLKYPEGMCLLCIKCHEDIMKSGEDYDTHVQQYFRDFTTESCFNCTCKNCNSRRADYRRPTKS